MGGHGGPPLLGGPPGQDTMPSWVQRFKLARRPRAAWPSGGAGAAARRRRELSRASQGLHVTDEELFAALDQVMGETGSSPSPWPASSSEPVDLDAGVSPTGVRRASDDWLRRGPACGSPAEIGELARGWSAFRGFSLN